jgi:hypothetical protein
MNTSNKTHFLLFLLFVAVLNKVCFTTKIFNYKLITTITEVVFPEIKLDAMQLFCHITAMNKSETVRILLYKNN